VDAVIIGAENAHVTKILLRIRRASRRRLYPLNAMVANPAKMPVLPTKG